MGEPLAHSTSDSLRLLVNPPGYAPGWQERIILPNPAAGAGWAYVANGPWHERLIAARWTLATDAAVANRLPRLQLQDANGLTLVDAGPSSTVVAGSVITISMATTVPVQGSGASGSVRSYLPDLLIPPGWEWSSAAVGYDAGDQESGVVLIVQRYPSDRARVVSPA